MTIDICVVFKMDTPFAGAISLLSTLPYPYREGGDSSRGRLYFDSTGPKFIITASSTEVERCIAAMSASPIVYEAYVANFEFFKD